MQLAEAVLRIQAAYPRIYLACHSQHQHARTTRQRLSQRDTTLLAHLSGSTPIRQGDLGRHLGLAKSTLSEALAHLVSCGYVARAADAARPRTVLLMRTAQGTAAMSEGSVLEAKRLERLLKRLSTSDQQRAIDGLELLASAATEAPR